LSKLEREQEAARAAAQAAGGGGGAAPPKSRLQLENAAAAAAEKAERMKAALAKARAAKEAKEAAAGAQQGLGEALKKAAPSKLERERDAWANAVGPVLFFVCSGAAEPLACIRVTCTLPMLPFHAVCMSHDWLCRLAAGIWVTGA
jgi:membrane protein involved in colicin uptake